jgi:hypothetical protein
VCALCGSRVGGVSAHADCCNGTGADRATRHNRMICMVGNFLMQAHGLYVTYEPILLECFNLKEGSLQEEDCPIRVTKGEIWKEERRRTNGKEVTCK